MATVAAVNELGSYVHNPRGNLWFNDESSYGQKLLSKMGWSKGKGLGKKEDGIKENLKVKFKNTNSGLGYKEESYTNVMKTEYDSILKSLSAEYPQKKTINGCNKGVEYKSIDFTQKSKVVKHKMRYPKLYYGKDVSKYSEKDMKSIFICSLASKDNEEEKSKDSRFGFKKEPENQMPKLQESYTSHLSISDYFNLKMKEKKDNEQMKKFSSKIKQEDSDSDCHRVDDVVKEEKTTYECNRTDYKLAQKKFALENNITDTIKREKCNSDCNERDYNIVDYNITDTIKRENCNSDCNERDYNIVDYNITDTIKREKCNSDCNERDYNIVEEKIDFQSHITENAMTRSSKKRHKMKKKLNTEANINGNDDELLSLEGEDRKDVITRNKKRKHLSEHSAYGEDLSEDKMSERSDFIDHQLSVPSKKRKKMHKKENLYTLSDDAALSSFQSDIHPDIVPNKKRKKSHRNADGASVGAVELLSVVSQKDEVSANSGLVCDISPSGSIDIIHQSMPDINNNNSTKKKKKLKNKLKSLNKLKSCLKSKSKEYAVKNVSFNENVSYQIIDSDNESIAPVSDCEDKVQNDLKLSTSDSDREHENDLSDYTLEIQDSSLSEQNGTNNSDALKTATEVEAEECKSSSLPSSSSSHYNSWVESQKLALKMKLYKNILKGIKKHDILKTTNLLSIKGYGSWGF